jgi:RHS repeat-associated protein
MVWAQSGTSPIPSGGVTYNNGVSGQAPTQPIGALTHVGYGGGDSDDFTYNVGTGSLASYTYHVTTQTVTGTLTWNRNGTLNQLQINDQLNSANTQTCNYTYDDLARVASVNCGLGGWGQSFNGNDVFGNIKKAVPTNSTGIAFQPTYDATTNRFSSIPGASVSYDSNGNLLADGSHTYTWDSDGRPHTIDSVTLVYDAMDRMVEQQSGSGNTEVVYGPTGKFALMNGQTLRKAFAPLPGGGTAVYIPGGQPAYYRHADWLGSSRLATTPSSPPANHLYFDGAYAPFGEDYAKTGTTDLSFAGTNQDTVTGLYDATFREYHPVQGRWISPDPAGLAAVSLGNPQTWNRYAYVMNNPVNFIDPLGLFCSMTWGTPEFPANKLFCDDEGSTSGGGGMNPHAMIQGGSEPLRLWDKLKGFIVHLGVRALGQTWSQCMAANANTYSIGGAFELTANVATGTSTNYSEKTSIVTGNGITDLFVEGPSADDFLTAASAGAGSPLTVGRTTSDITSLNLAGKGGLPKALGSTGAKGAFESAGNWLNFGLDEAEKFAVDAGLAGAESFNCAIPR